MFFGCIAVLTWLSRVSARIRQQQQDTYGTHQKQLPSFHPPWDQTCPHQSPTFPCRSSLLQSNSSPASSNIYNENRFDIVGSAVERSRKSSQTKSRDRHQMRKRTILIAACLSRKKKRMETDWNWFQWSRSEFVDHKSLGEGTKVGICKCWSLRCAQQPQSERTAYCN